MAQSSQYTSLPPHLVVRCHTTEKERAREGVAMHGYIGINCSDWKTFIDGKRERGDGARIRHRSDWLLKERERGGVGWGQSFRHCSDRKKIVHDILFRYFLTHSLFLPTPSILSSLPFPFSLPSSLPLPLPSSLPLPLLTSLSPSLPSGTFVVTHRHGVVACT